MSIKSNLQHSAYQQAIKKHRRATQKKQALNFKQAKRFVILYNLSESDNKENAEALAQQLRSAKKEVNLVAFTPENQAPTDLQHDCLCKKDLNWAKIPKSEKLDPLLKDPCDVLVTLYKENSPALDFLLQTIDTKMTVGYLRNSFNEYYDVMVHNKQAKLPLAIQQIQDALNRINK